MRIGITCTQKKKIFIVNYNRIVSQSNFNFLVNTRNIIVAPTSNFILQLISHWHIRKMFRVIRVKGRRFSNPFIVAVIVKAIQNFGLKFLIIVMKFSTTADTLFSVNVCINHARKMFCNWNFKIIFNIKSHVLAVTYTRKILCLRCFNLTLHVVTLTYDIVFNPQLDIIHTNNLFGPNFHSVRT